MNRLFSRRNATQFLALVTAFVFAALFAVSTDAQEQSGPLPGHSYHGEAFDEGPRQKAYLMENCGHVHLPITAKDPLAQKFFDQGVGQLYGFWYFEAERSFRQASSLDTNAPMPYLGMAWANSSNIKRVRGFIKQAVAHKANASPREQRWIALYEELWKGDRQPDKEHWRELANGLEKLKKDFPDEVEAKAFLAFQIYDNSSRSLAITNNEAMDALLREVLKAEPMHPVHHARIHFWDSRKAENALPDAAACGQSAPSVAHMWHMPGHIYDKLKRYPDAVWQMEASARTDHAFMLRDHVLPDQIHNYAHNNEWLTRNLSNIGRMRDAVDLARNMIELPRHPKFNTFEKGSTYYGRTRLGDILNSWEMWNETLALADTIYLEADGSAADRAKRLRLIGLANFHKGNTAQGEQQISALEAMLKDDAKPPGDSKNSAPPSNRQPVENALAEVRLVRALESKQLKAAQEQFAKVKDLSKERQAQYQFAFGEKDKALQLAREAVQAGTNQVRVLANYTDLLYRAGKWKDAYDNFLRLRELASQADIDAPVLQRLAPVAKDLKFGANWRPPLKKPDDVGARPALDKLGPFRWHPWQAADWSLATGDGRTLSLKSYRGRPVIVIFYLGHGCAHCIEQLNAFAPLAQEFADAGISLVAVSTDSVDGLSKTHEKAKQAGGFPFPLVSDQSLKIFKAYRAFDDFENQPLHGSFLVDGDGFVRWQDISYQPFMETKFLLDEAKRLLKEPRTRVLAGQPMRVTSKPTDAACK